MPASSISCCPPRPTSSLFPGDRGSKSVLQRQEHSWILEEREDLCPKAVDWWGDGGGGKSGEGRWEKESPGANAWRAVRRQNPADPPQDLDPTAGKGSG